MFDDDYIRRFCSLLRPGYKPPTPEALSGKLLDECYLNVKTQVDCIISAESSLGVCVDESTNVKNNLITTHGAFFQGHINLGARTADASLLSTIIQNSIAEFGVEGSSEKITSFATDTCAVMRSVWKQLKQNNIYSKALYIPCDSHGLQLLIKNILELSEFFICFKHISSIVSFFKKSPKQYGLLKCKMEEQNTKSKTLICSVITRWGTQARMIHRLLDHHEALINWAYDNAKSKKEDQSKTAETTRQIIYDIQFWDRLKKLYRIVQPIHLAQTDSEGVNQHLGLIYRRWLSIHTKLRIEFQSNSELFGDWFNKKQFWAKFDARERKQLLPLHYLAFYLDPSTLDVELPRDRQSQLFETIKQLIDDLKDAENAIAEFVQFRNKRTPYPASHASWILKNRALSFWQSCEEDKNLLLPPLATRLLSTVANSVASERGFSTMNLIHSASRNSLSLEKVSKLCYIHINQRVLDQQGSEASAAIHRLTEKQQEKFEQEMGYIKTNGFEDSDSEAADEAEEDASAQGDSQSEAEGAGKAIGL